MPAKSKAQFRLMQAAAHGASYGPSAAVAKEFISGNYSKLPERKKKNVRKNESKN